MIDGLASGLHSAGSWTGVSALQSDTSRRLGAVGILGTLGPASFVRVAYVVRWTGTGTNAVVLATDRVGAAGGGLAWFSNVWVYIWMEEKRFNWARRSKMADRSLRSRVNLSRSTNDSLQAGGRLI